ncbi:MAG: D-alanyl-D-alanine carboxypeptidase/D-alanyl-D-alanine-endopeptidase, partial [Syntrophothermus sp.]
GEAIVDQGSFNALAPASCLKLLTTSAALEGLGEEYRYITELYYSGTIKNGTLNGNIYIKGSGDPSLGSSQVTGSPDLDSLMSIWTIAVRKAGIKKINGKIISDSHKYGLYTIPEDWTWADMGNYYGAGTSSVTINDNFYKLFFKPAADSGLPASVIRTEPEIKRLNFTNYMLTGKAGSGDNGYIYCAPLQHMAVLRGTVPAGEAEFSIKGSIPDPPFFAAEYFAGKLLSAGIKFKGRSDVSKIAEVSDEKINYEKFSLLFRHVSPPLKDIVYIINKKSNNLYTEQILRELAFVKYGESSTETGIKAVYDFLNKSGIPAEGVYLHDGCGLSRSDAVTARTLAKLLSFNTRQVYFNSFYNSLGIAGKKDDISSFRNTGTNTIIADNAHIKDGYIGGVRSHTGYVKARNGRLIAFSFICNNFKGRSRAVGEIYTDLIMRLAGLD